MMKLFSRRRELDLEDPRLVGMAPLGTTENGGFSNHLTSLPALCDNGGPKLKPSSTAPVISMGNKDETVKLRKKSLQHVSTLVRDSHNSHKSSNGKK